MGSTMITKEHVQELIPNARNLSLIAKGGQKYVFSGEIKGVKYAIKVIGIQKNFGETIDTIIDRAKREIDLIAKCNSPYISKIGPIRLEKSKIGQQNLVYFTEEFIEGKTLRDLHKSSGNLRIEQLHKLAYNISSAIQELWEFRIVHRDIKPENIICQENTRDFILLDMGIALALDEDTLSQNILGTRNYICPEQMDFSNRKIVMNFKCDLFTLGIVLYEMATGKHPFKGPDDNSDNTIRNIVSKRHKCISCLRDDLPVKFVNVIDRLLSKEQSLRYRTIGMLHDELDEIKEEL